MMAAFQPALSEEGPGMHTARFVIEIAAFVAVAIVVWRMFSSKK